MSNFKLSINGKNKEVEADPNENDIYDFINFNIFIKSFWRISILSFTKIFIDSFIQRQRIN